MASRLGKPAQPRPGGELATPADDLHVSVATGAWLFIVPSLASSSLQSIGGRLGDIFGYRRVFVIGALGFIVASLMAAAAPSFWALVAGRVLMMVGSSAIQPNTGALVVLKTWFDVWEETKYPLTEHPAGRGAA